MSRAAVRLAPFYAPAHAQRRPPNSGVPQGRGREGGIKGCPDNRERKSERLGLRAHLAGLPGVGGPPVEPRSGLDPAGPSRCRPGCAHGCLPRLALSQCIPATFLPPSAHRLPFSSKRTRRDQCSPTPHRPAPSRSYPHQAFHNNTSRKVGRFKSTMKWSLFNPVLSSLGKCSNTVGFQRGPLMRRACQVYQLQPP